MWTQTPCWSGCRWVRVMSVTCNSLLWSNSACYCSCQITSTAALRRKFVYLSHKHSVGGHDFRIQHSLFLTVTPHLSARCPPRTFLPALCKIFLDESAPDNVLEVTARAITYYLDVSAECTRRIVGVDGAIKALCNRLVVVELNNRTSRDLAEQCVKVGDN